VHNGDTIRVLCGGVESRIRFACIDSREINQPGGIEDRNYLRALLNQGSNQVRVETVKKDRYGRTIVLVWTNRGRDWELVQKLMAETGHGFAYHQYKNDCKSWDTVLKAEEEARQQKLGVWAISNPQPSWEWRR
jgi:endonuclease YncB( thermonuclease family)